MAMWLTSLWNEHMSCGMTKSTKWVCAQRRLRSAWASTQSDQSSLCAQWIAKDPSFLHAESKDSDQTGRIPRLIWVLAGGTLIVLVLSCHGSIILMSKQDKVTCITCISQLAISARLLAILCFLESLIAVLLPHYRCLEIFKFQEEVNDADWWCYIWVLYLGFEPNFLIVHW